MIYKSLIKPLLFQFDAEKVHNLACSVAEATAHSRLLSSAVERLYNFQSPLLTQTFWDQNFRNPIGIAAGFDKNGKLVQPFETLGAGFVEVGSITAQPRCGNPKPRAFRLPKDLALINRMGLNNDGAQTIIKRLQNTKFTIPVGVNIAKTHDPNIMGDKAIKDYLLSYREAQNIADYITINISCPNTEEGKTFEDPEILDTLLDELINSNKIDSTPTLVKFSSDIGQDDLKALLEVCEEHHIDGYVACNTSSSRRQLATGKATLEAIGHGGLSGSPLAPKSRRIIRWIRNIIGERKPIIGVGGVDSFESALKMLKAGADLLQVYTGLIYTGPALIKNINQQLVQYIQENDLSSIKEIT